MVSSGGLLGRRKASFSTSKTSAGNGNSSSSSNSNPNNNSGFPSASSSSDRLPSGQNGTSHVQPAGVKLTLDSAADDDLDASGEMENGGIKISNYSFNAHDKAAAGFPVVGAGSRYVSKVTIVPVVRALTSYYLAFPNPAARRSCLNWANQRICQHQLRSNIRLRAHGHRSHLCRRHRALLLSSPSILPPHFPATARQAGHATSAKVQP